MADETTPVGPPVFDLTPLMVAAKRERGMFSVKGVPVRADVIIPALTGAIIGVIIPILMLSWWAPWQLTVGGICLFATAGVWAALWRRKGGLNQQVWRSAWDWASAGEHKVWYCGRDVTRDPDRGPVKLVGLLD